MVDDQSRHQRVSVAVVDFDMPKMSGVEFCRAIRDLPVKTILLTGKAGLETAIAAFNEGVIDCFLQKQDAHVSIALRREIKRLQAEYFEKISDPIKCALALQKPSFFVDPSFLELFKEVSENNRVSEHYVCASPPGIMMRDVEGNESFLLISDLEFGKEPAARSRKTAAPRPTWWTCYARARRRPGSRRQEGDLSLRLRGGLGAIHLAGAAAARLGLVELQRHSPRAPARSVLQSQRA